MNSKKISVIILFMLTFIIIILSWQSIQDYTSPYDKKVEIVLLVFALPFLLRYLVYMVLAPWYPLVTKAKYARFIKMYPQYKPRVSVLIPAWNEEVGIINTLKSVIDSNYGNLEIVVVNDGSTDRSDEIIKAFLKDYTLTNPEIIYHYQPNGGKASALNTALKLATGDIFITIDADSVVSEETVGEFVRHFIDPEVMCVAGNVKIGNKNSFLGLVQYFEYLYGFYCRRADSLMGTIYIVGGAAAAYRREVFEILGEFNENSITEDLDLSMRIQEAGMKIEYAEKAVVFTEGACDLKGLKKQRLRWKRGRLEAFFKYKNMFFNWNKPCNPRLSWFILPLALLAEVQLLFELVFIAMIYGYALFSHNFVFLCSPILFVGGSFLIVNMNSCAKHHNALYGFYSFIGWLLFYVVTFVEYNSLVKSIIALVRKQQVKWQRWERKGVFN